jgi:hypothetical protein
LLFQDRAIVATFNDTLYSEAGIDKSTIPYVAPVQYFKAKFQTKLLEISPHDLTGTCKVLYHLTKHNMIRQRYPYLLHQSPQPTTSASSSLSNHNGKSDSASSALTGKKRSLLSPERSEHNSQNSNLPDDVNETIDLSADETETEKQVYEGPPLHQRQVEEEDIMNSSSDSEAEGEGKSSRMLISPMIPTEQIEEGKKHPQQLQQTFIPHLPYEILTHCEVDVMIDEKISDIINRIASNLHVDPSHLLLYFELDHEETPGIESFLPICLASSFISTSFSRYLTQDLPRECNQHFNHYNDRRHSHNDYPPYNNVINLTNDNTPVNSRVTWTRMPKYRISYRITPYPIVLEKGEDIREPSLNTYRTFEILITDERIRCLRRLFLQHFLEKKPEWKELFFEFDNLDVLPISSPSTFPSSTSQLSLSLTSEEERNVNNHRRSGSPNKKQKLTEFSNSTSSDAFSEQNLLVSSTNSISHGNLERLSITSNEGKLVTEETEGSGYYPHSEEKQHHQKHQVSSQFPYTRQFFDSHSLTSSQSGSSSPFSQSYDEKQHFSSFSMTNPYHVREDHKVFTRTSAAITATELATHLRNSEIELPFNILSIMNAFKEWISASFPYSSTNPEMTHPFLSSELFTEFTQSVYKVFENQKVEGWKDRYFLQSVNVTSDYITIDKDAPATVTESEQEEEKEVYTFTPEFPLLFGLINDNRVSEMFAYCTKMSASKNYFW